MANIPVFNPLDMLGNEIIDLADPTSAQHAATKNYIDTKTLDTLAVAVAALNLNGQKISNLGTPTVSTDAATKAYVDAQMAAVAAGFDPKASVVAMAVGNVAVANPATSTFDGIVLTAGQRLLLTQQTSGVENGIYIFNGAGAALTRATDCNSNANYVTGAYTLVEEGTQYAGTGWVVQTQGNINPGVTAVTWVQFGKTSAPTAGTGIVVAGQQVSVDTTVVARKAVATFVSDGATLNHTVNHNLNTSAPVVEVYRSTDNAAGIIAKAVVDANNVQISFTASSVPANGVTVTVVVVG